MIRIAIVDDNDGERSLLAEYIDRFFAGGENEISVTYYKDGMDIVSQYRSGFDIIFMDIEMKLLDGLKAAVEIRRLDSRVILLFVTRLAQYAVKGYEVDALGFMVKPVTYSHFELQMKKALKRLQTENEEECLWLSSGQNKRRIALRDLYYIEVARHELYFHTSDGVIKGYGALKDYAARLEESNFALCNQSYLVNLHYVTAVENGEVVVRGEHIIISRTCKKAFMKALSGYFNGI